MNTRTLGIIGGAGPAAGVVIHQMILEEWRAMHISGMAAQSDTDFPDIVHTSFHVDDAGFTGDFDPVELERSLRKAVKVLQAAEVDAVVVACNSISNASAAILETLGVPVITGETVLKQNLPVDHTLIGSQYLASMPITSHIMVPGPGIADLASSGYLSPDQEVELDYIIATTHKPVLACTEYGLIENQYRGIPNISRMLAWYAVRIPELSSHQGRTYQGELT